MADKQKKENFFKKAAGKIANGAKATKSEVKKISWPTRKQLFNNTAIVIACIIVVGVVIFALDTDEPTSESKLFHYPYGNVRESGSICFGNITLKVKDIADAPKVFDDFLCGKTNNDLYHTQNTRGFSQGELVSYVENLEVYPKELLLKNGKTFGDL